MSDPLDDLGALWRDPAADAPPPPMDLESTDAETRAAVQWMQAAWRAGEAEGAPEVPFALRRAAARRGRPSAARRLALPLGLPLAAAAAVALWLAWPAGDVDAPALPAPVDVATDVADAGTTPSVVDPTPIAPPPVAAAPLTFEPDAFVPRKDGVELVSGKVRVILLDADLQR